jgi:hypothetical protein
MQANDMTGKTTLYGVLIGLMDDDECATLGA